MEKIIIHDMTGENPNKTKKQLYVAKSQKKQNRLHLKISLSSVIIL